MEKNIDYAFTNTPTPASLENEEKQPDRIKYYFISDLHFGHKNILKHNPKRCELMGLDINDPDVIEKHDQWIINKWKETIRRKDYVYILGDFSFYSTEKTEKILQQLPGQKFLIRGNHDASCRGLEKYFLTVSDIKEVIFKKKNPNMAFLDENLRVMMCHYPMLTWNNRMRGEVHLHGHVHGHFDEFNIESKELRRDVGFDSQTIRNTGNIFIEIEEVYNLLKQETTHGEPFSQYMQEREKEIGHID